MRFDLRLPVGLMFTVFGLILIALGLFGGEALTEKSLGIDMNLWWGIVELLFGAAMLFFGWRRSRRHRQRFGQIGFH